MKELNSFDKNGFSFSTTDFIDHETFFSNDLRVDLRVDENKTISAINKITTIGKNH